MKQAAPEQRTLAVLQRAIALQQSGALDEALTLCEGVLAENAHDANALHLSGLILCQSGDVERGAARLEAAVAADPANAVVRFNLGKALADLKRFEDAAESYRQALAIMPDNLDAQYNLGNALSQSGADAAAIDAFSAVLEVRPDHDGAHYNRALALQRAKRLEEAVDAFEHYLHRHPDHADSHYNMAVCLHNLERYDAALAAYRACLAIEPANQSARHLAAALSGDPSDAPPKDYVVGLFDGYAARFEEHLVKALDYKVPTLLRALVGEGRRFATALDLGCGTGLAGREFREMVDSFHAIDLSPNMVEEARARGVYDHVRESDICAYLDADGPMFDLVIATDVFIYVGRLEDVFEAVSRRCAAGALFAFSTEAFDGEAFGLLPSGRYAHAPAYIHGLARANGFTVCKEKAVTLRKGEAGDVPGFLTVLAKD